MWVSRKVAVAALSAVVVLGTAPSRADDVVTIRTIGSSADGIGQTLRYGEDFDDDGKADYLVESAFGVRALSSATGLAIRDYAATGHAGFLGRSLAFLPDMDADGVVEILAGAPGTTNPQIPPGAAIVFSGKTGAEIRRVTGSSPLLLFGEQVVSLGDVTGDGVADFAVGAPGQFAAAPGEFHGYSGADGSAIPWLDKVGTGTDTLGFAMVALGDVNNDGVTDLAVGSPGANNPEGAPPPLGRVEIYSGKDGRVLRRIQGKATFFGYSLVNAGDVDGDGAADVAVGGSAAPYVSVHSSRTGKRLRRLFRPPTDMGNYFGDTLSARTGGDVDGDGRADVAAVQNTAQGPIFFVFGSASLAGVPLDRFQPAPSIFLGDIALVPDADGDGIADLAVSVQGDSIRILKVTPDLAPAFTFVAALTRPQSTALIQARGTFTVKVSKSVQSVVVKCSGLKAGRTYAVRLEEGVGAREFVTVGTLTLHGTSGALTVSATGTPPAALGITSLAQITGRRVQLRDSDGDVVLEAVLPLPGPTSSTSGRIPLLRDPATTFATASGAVSLKYTARTGGLLFALAVKGVPAATPLVLEIEDAPGSGVFVAVGPLTRGKFTRDTKRGETLPGGGGTYGTISGRAIRVVSGAEVVLAGRLP